MGTARVFHHLQNEAQKPVVLIAGDLQFIGYFLQQLLVHQNCRVVSFAEFSKKEIEKIDYIFSLGETRVEKIKALLKIAEKFDAKFLLASYHDSLTEEVAKNFFQERKIDGRIVRLVNVYGPRMDFDKYQELLQSIKVAKTKPVFVSDAVYALVKAMFSSGTSGKVFTLNDKSSLDWQPKVSLEEGLRQTERYFGRYFGKKQEKKIKKGEEKKDRPKRNCLLVGLTLIFFFVSLFFYPFASLFFNGFMGARNLKKAQEMAQAADFAKAAAYAQSSQRFFNQAKQKITRLAFLFALLGQEKAARRAGKVFDVGEKVAWGLVYLGQAAEQGGHLGKIIFQEAPGEIKTSVSKIKLELDFAYNQFSLAEADLKLEPTILQMGKSLGFNLSLENPKETLPQTREVIIQIKKALFLIPSLVGLEKKQTFLVLLQNNMELRPTGGFITSYALLTFDKGRLLDFEVKDVYTADGQLKGHVEPPTDLKKYLGEGGWYLRDSNWDPDFPSSAAKAAWFLEKETGRVVDGVFALNFFFVQKLLQATGEIEVPKYQEKISANNLLERVEYHSEASLFPKEPPKQEFFGLLVQALFEKIKKADQKTWVKLGKMVYQGAKEKDILVYLNERATMEVIADLGWDGGIRSLKCQGSSIKCFVDYLMIVEANVGVNRANYFVERKLVHQVQVDPQGRIEETLRINLKNNSQSEVFPAGRYKTYLRILTPLGTMLKRVVVGGEELSKEKIEKFVLHEKQVFGFLVEVPTQEEKAIEISYQLANKLLVENGAQYLLLFQKQSGAQNKDFSFWFTPPQGSTILSTRPKTTFTGQTVAFTPSLDQDLVLEIRLAR